VLGYAPDALDRFERAALCHPFEETAVSLVELLVRTFGTHHHDAERLELDDVDANRGLWLRWRRCDDRRCIRHVRGSRLTRRHTEALAECPCECLRSFEADAARHLRDRRRARRQQMGRTREAQALYRRAQRFSGERTVDAHEVERREVRDAGESRRGRQIAVVLEAVRHCGDHTLDSFGVVRLAGGFHAVLRSGGESMPKVRRWRGSDRAGLRFTDISA